MFYLGENPSLSKERLSDLMDSALFGGSNYWYWLSDADSDNITKIKGNTFGAKIINYVWQNTNVVPVTNAENTAQVLGKFSFETIINGCKLMAQTRPREYNQILNGTNSLVIADMLFQSIVLGGIHFM